MDMKEYGETVEQAQQNLIAAAKQMSVTANEFIEALNQILEVLKRYGNE